MAWRAGSASAEGALTAAALDLLPEDDASAIQVIGGHLDDDAITDQGADAVLLHLARRIGEDFVLIIQSDPEPALRQQFGDDTVELDQFFLGQGALSDATG